MFSLLLASFSKATNTLHFTGYVGSARTYSANHISGHYSMMLFVEKGIPVFYYEIGDQIIRCACIQDSTFHKNWMGKALEDFTNIHLRGIQFTDFSDFTILKIDSGEAVIEKTGIENKLYESPAIDSLSDSIKKNSFDGKATIFAFPEGYITDINSSLYGITITVQYYNTIIFYQALERTNVKAGDFLNAGTILGTGKPRIIRVERFHRNIKGHLEIEDRQMFLE